MPHSSGRSFGTGSANANNYYYSQQRYHDSTSSDPLQDTDHSSIIMVGLSLLWNTIALVTDFITGPYFGVVVALGVIVCFPFRSNLQDLYYNAKEDGLRQTLLDLVIHLGDMARAYFQIACELMRSCRQHFLFDAQADHSFPFPHTYNGRQLRAQRSPDAYNDSNDRPGRSSGLMRNSAHFLLPASYGPPPPLVLVDDRGRVVSRKGDPNDRRSPSPTTSTSSMSTNGSSINTNTIEPAFLNERDYPKGWLVYHAVLGVVSKEEADLYDERQIHQSEQPEQQVLQELHSTDAKITLMDDCSVIEHNAVQSSVAPAADVVVSSPDVASDISRRQSSSASGTTSPQYSLSIRGALAPPATAAVNG